MYHHQERFRTLCVYRRKRRIVKTHKTSIPKTLPKTLPRTLPKTLPKIPYIVTEYDLKQINEFMDTERPIWLKEEIKIQKIFDEEYERVVMLEAEIWYHQEIDKRKQIEKDKEMQVFFDEFSKSFEK